MSTYTTNYNLEKPDSTDDFKDFRSNYNSNMDIIDEHLGQGGGGGSDVSWNQLQVTGDKIATIRISGIDTDVYSPNARTFSMAISRANIDSGEDYSTIFGKIKKWFDDLKTVAFTGKSSDLTNDANFLTPNDVTVTQIQSTGTKIATIDVDGTPTDLYAPNGGASALNDLTDVDITSPSNGQVLKYDASNNEWVNSNEGAVEIIPNPVDPPTTPLNSLGFYGTNVVTVLDNGMVSTNSSYAWASYRTTLVNGVTYDLKLTDSFYPSNPIYSSFTWQGSTIALTLGDRKQLTIEATRAGLTYYPGAWRQHYLDIKSQIQSTVYSVGNVSDVEVNGSSVVNNGVAEITEIDNVGLTSTLELGTSTADGTLDGQLELWGGTPLFRGKATLKAHHAQTGDLTFELPATGGTLALATETTEYLSVVNGAVNITFYTM